MTLRGQRLVIFGCGYLGERVVGRTLQEGLEITALTRNAGQAEVLRRMGVRRVVVAELQSDAWHSEVDPGSELILNCVSSAGGGWDGYRASYLEGMKSILGWLAAGGSGSGTLVFTSSTSVYAQTDGSWVDEASSADGASEGARILLEAERLLESRPRGVGRAFVLRLGGIYGPGRHYLIERAMNQEFQAEEGDEIFLNSIRVEDAAAAVWSAFGAPDGIEGGTFNIVDDRPAPKGEIVGWLREEMGRRGLAFSATSSDAAGRGRRRSGRTNRRISNARAKGELGWRPSFPDYRAGYGALLEALGRED
jgi:nucleoside-diphosphate-sugar epimerase